MAEVQEQKEQPGALDEQGLKELNSLLSSLKHGSITLIIQNGKVVQIEKNEKLRLA
jgi:hypothetical protein